MVSMKKAQLRLNVACLGTSAYGLMVSLNENTRLCPANVRSAVRRVADALAQKHCELMFESSCKLVKAMDKVFTKKSVIYTKKGFQGEPVRDWYLRVTLFLIALNQMDDKKSKKTKEWMKTAEGSSFMKLIEFRLFQVAEELVRSDEEHGS